jgi:2-methylisocitrate lyase-like PEP mutase family enzyme
MNDDRLIRFRALHERGTFVMPNPWDVGSAVILAELGFLALATTSAGFATSIGKRDQQVTLDELLVHAEQLAGAVDVPLNVDAERCYADDLGGVARTVELLAATGAAGCSIEDYDPATGAIDDRGKAAERVAAAAESARQHGIVLTARAENHLYGVTDLDDTIGRLCAYRDAGAEVLYAPGLIDIVQIAAVVREVGAPINVLRVPDAPNLDELAAAGVRRVSTGGGLARAAYSSMRRIAEELLAAHPR